MPAATAARNLADPRWPALAGRDPAADGRFVYAVTSTGIYCRPTCPSRLARPENIRFFTTPAEARQAGYRPCRRCQPDGESPAAQQARRVAELCHYIAAAEHAPSLDELARHAGLSAWHLHRQFKAVTGLTPHAYVQAQRAERMRRQLAPSADGDAPAGIADAIYAAGYNADSRFYSEADAILGMKPGDFRAGGRGEQIRYACAPCRLGQVLAAQSSRGLCAILLGDDPILLGEDLRQRFPNAHLLPGKADLAKTLAAVVALVDTPGSRFELPLDLRGTLFQQRVWQALRQIPPGQTLSYSQLAERLGQPRAVRAVASACAANPLAVAVPCHRVLRSDGSLSGYRWGLERKRALLDTEAAPDEAT